MKPEIVTVVVGGQRWTAFESVSVAAAVKHAARSFSLTIAAESGPVETAALFQVFAPVQIYGNGDLILSGYIDARKAKLTPAKGEVVITGRSKGADAIDSAAKHKTGRFENKTPLDIAKELDMQGVGFSSSVDLDKIKEFQLTPGETVWRTIERLARDQGVTPRGMPDGSIDLWNADSQKKRHAGMLLEGDNIEEIESDHDGANRHSHVHVRGQKYDGHGEKNLRIESIARDEGVPRYRPQVIIADGDVDQARADKRSKNHQDRKAGHGLRCSVLTPTWRDEASALWTPGHLVFVQSPFAAVTQDMLLETVSFEQTSERTSARLGLVDPRAYKGAKGKVNKSGKGWK
jgi:prophage tail gpP-like protein